MPTRKFGELLSAMPVGRRRKIADRVRQSLASMPLDEFRKARQMTQAKLADALGVNQGGVSKIERRTDIYLSTLAGYVEAWGEAGDSGNFSGSGDANRSVRGSPVDYGGVWAGRFPLVFRM